LINTHSRDLRPLRRSPPAREGKGVERFECRCLWSCEPVCSRRHTVSGPGFKTVKVPRIAGGSRLVVRCSDDSHEEIANRLRIPRPCVSLKRSPFPVRGCETVVIFLHHSAFCGCLLAVPPSRRTYLRTFYGKMITKI